jgi:hypothetical protein
MKIVQGSYNKRKNLTGTTYSRACLVVANLRFTTLVSGYAFDTLTAVNQCVKTLHLQ